jgi:glycosyltransferase involved in cell wall biosynthesis
MPWDPREAKSRILMDLAAGRPLSGDARITAELVQLANSHGLVGLLAEEVGMPVVKAAHARLDVRQEVMRRNLSRILERMHQEGIRVSVLKGARMADTFYRDPRRRTFTDIDLLVETHSLENALDLLADDEAVVAVPAKRPKADKRDLVLADSTGVTFHLDLHWNLFAYTQLRGAATGATESAWKRAEFYEGSSIGPYWSLPSGHEVCFLAAHSILDHRFRLILFRDFVEITNGPVEWEEVMETAHLWGLRSVTYIALWIASQAFGANVPNELLKALRPRSETVTLLEHMLPRVDFASFDGHRVHPVNLACVLLNDSASSRLGLAFRAPLAFPAWRRRAAMSPTVTASSRMLLVVSSNRRRGAEVFAERLRDGLLDKGFVVEAVSLSEVNETARADVESITDRAPSDIGRLDPRIAMSLRRKVGKFRPELVVASGPTLRYGVLATVGRATRLVYVAIGEPRYWIRSRLSEAIHRFLLRRSDQVIAVSTATRSQLLDFEPALAGRVQVGYTGVPEGMFRDPAAQNAGPLRVLVVGALSVEKDPLAALRAVASVDDALVRMVGSGPLETAVREEAGRLGMDHRLELTGAVDDVEVHLEWADVLLLSSRTEGLPAAILEAGAASVPAIAFDVGGVKEAVVDGVSGVVVPAGDDDGLTSALSRLSADRNRLAEMGLAAHRHVASRFRLDRVVDEYVRLLTADLARSKR